MRRLTALLTLAMLAACVTESIPAQVPVDTTGWRYTDSVPTAWRYTDSLPVLDTLTPPPPPPDTTPASSHEPRGGTVVADHDWSGFSPSVPAPGAARFGWVRYQKDGNNGTWLRDSTAPGDPDVLEVPKRGKQGTGDEHLELLLPAGARTLYIRAPVWVPSTYTGSSSGVQKLFHLWAPYDKGVTGSLAVPSIFGIGAKGLQSQIRIQNATPTAAHATSFNIGGKPWARGRWVVTEWLLVMNTAGQANGEAHLWQDGQLAASRRGITYSKAGAPWQKIQLNPTYGGTGATPNPPQRLRYGRIRVVTAP